jgi:hypothetical protein
MVNVVRLPCNLLADPEANVKNDLSKEWQKQRKAEEHRNKSDMKKRLT